MRAVAACLFVVLATLSAAAQPAPSAEEAKRIQASLEPYFGAPRSGEGPSVTVTAGPDAYRVEYGFDRLMRPLARFGYVVEPVTMVSSLTHGTDGTWRSRMSGPLDYVVRFGDARTRHRIDVTSSEAIFDEGQVLLRSGATAVELQSWETTSPAGTYAASIRSPHANLAIRANGDGTIRVIQSETTGPATMAFPLALPPTAPDGKPSVLKVDTSWQASRGEVLIDGLDRATLGKAWFFLATHDETDRLKAAERELRAVLGAALPVVRQFKVAGEFDGLAVRLPFATASASRARLLYDLPGLVPSAEIGLGVQASTVEILSDRVPAWAMPLMPTELNVGIRVGGIDLEAPARTAIEDLEFGDTFRLDPSVVAALVQGALAGSTISLTVPPGRIQAPLYDLAFEAHVAITDRIPSGTATISATGLDKVIAALQRSAGAPGVSTTLIALHAAQALAKPGADGGLLWEIGFDGAGKVLVNGKPLPGQRKT